MIDLIILFFLTRSIGFLAESKGLPTFKWKLLTVVLWISFEIVGLVIGAVIFGVNNLADLILLALACGFGGYLIVRYTLEKKPDATNDIDNIGNY